MGCEGEPVAVDETGEDGSRIVDPYPEIGRRVYGVFKGGGAKGIVYAGALRELAARGVWFQSVAGSSAGAITAMLVAINTPPDEFAGAAVGALPQVRRKLLRGFVTKGRSLFETEQLRQWLEDELQHFVGPHSSGRPVTFGRLACASALRSETKLGAIGLDVVALDLDRRQPIVFNAKTTPHCSVASAVVASCAIPLAMPPGRVRIGDDGATGHVHRIVDGGAWANYPSFVYTDERFRSWNDLRPEHIPADDVLGFVIVGDEDAEPPLRDSESRRPWPPVVPEPSAPPDPETITMAIPRRSVFDRGAGRRSGTVGAILSWTALRWLIGVAMPAAALALLIWWLLRSAHTQFTFVDDFPAWAQLAAIFVVMLGVVTVAALICLVLLVQARIASEAFDVGVPSLSATLSVGTGVADWVVAKERIVRLAPPAGIGTTTFNAPRQYVELAVMVGELQAGTQLNVLFPDCKRHCVPPTTIGPVPYPRRSTFVTFAGFTFLSVLTAVGAVGFLRYNAEVLDSSDMGAAFIIALIAGGVVGVVLAAVKDRDERRAEAGGPLHVDPAGMYEHLTKERVARRPSPSVTIAAFVLTGFWSLALLNSLIGGDVGASILSLVLLLPSAFWLGQRLVAGRRFNQGLVRGDFVRRSPYPRLVGGALLTALGVLLLNSVDSGSEPRTTVGRSTGLWFATVVLIAGVGVLVAGLAAIHVRRQYDRYLAELRSQ